MQAKERTGRDGPQRGSPICFGTHSNLKRSGNWPLMLEIDIKGKNVKAQFEIASLVSSVHQGQQDVDMIKS